MKKLKVFESKDLEIEEEISISNYRMETLAKYLDNYQDLRHLKRNSTIKSDINYIENKITGILKKINKFVAEFGIDSLKNKLKDYYETDSFSVVLDESIQYLTESAKSEKVNEGEDLSTKPNINSYSPDIVQDMIYVDMDTLLSVNENTSNIEDIAIDMQLKTNIEQPLEFFYEVVSKLLKSDYNNENQLEIDDDINGVTICFNPMGDHIFIEFDGTDDVYQVSKSKLDEINNI